MSTPTSSVLLKVEAAGNDFVLGSGRWAERLSSDPGLVARLCDRRRGIGADGALALTAASATASRLDYRNADGSPALFCANGTRCAARVGVELLALPARHQVVTAWAPVTAEVAGERVALILPAPDGPPRRVELEAAGLTLSGELLEVGVPHLVIEVDELDGGPLVELAPSLRTHPSLGESGANVDLVAAGEGADVRLRTWERGVATETLACGSGVVAAALLSLAATGARRLEVEPRSGTALIVEALGEPPRCASRLIGPARIVAEIRPSEELLGSAESA